MLECRIKIKKYIFTVVPKSEKATYISLLKIVHEMIIVLYKPKREQCNIELSSSSKYIDENPFYYRPFLHHFIAQSHFVTGSATAVVCS